MRPFTIWTNSPWHLTPWRATDEIGCGLIISGLRVVAAFCGSTISGYETFPMATITRRNS